MGAPVKRKREQDEAPAASTSTQAAKKSLEEVSWPSIFAGIQGQRGEPGAIEGAQNDFRSTSFILLQICLERHHKAGYSMESSMELTVVVPCL